MTMKILNRFIDDCVNVFQYRFMDTFQYFKERNKNKYLGDRFEEWVVKNSNISKDGCSDLDTGKIFWRLLDWRGDKYVEGYRPLSSSSPDLLLECAVDRSRIYKVGEIIAVECKWRSKVGFYLDRKDIEKYEVYMNINQLNRPIKSLFYVFGFGWVNDAPIIRKSKFPQNPKRSVRFSGKGTKRSVQKRKARNTQKAETKVL